MPSHDPEASPGSAPDSSEEKEGMEVPVGRRRAREAEPLDAGARRRNLVLLMGLVAAGAAVAVLALGGMKDKAIYSKPVDDLVAHKAKFLGRPVRAEGNLVHGTLMKREQPCEYRFTITKNGVDVPVRYAQCVVPDTFRDVPGMDVAVTVEGELQADNSFEATSVLAKCPSKYEMNQRAQNGEHMPQYVGPTQIN